MSYIRVTIHIHVVSTKSHLGQTAELGRSSNRKFNCKSSPESADECVWHGGLESHFSTRQKQIVRRPSYARAILMLPNTKIRLVNDRSAYRIFVFFFLPHVCAEATTNKCSNTPTKDTNTTIWEKEINCSPRASRSPFFLPLNWGRLSRHVYLYARENAPSATLSM